MADYIVLRASPDWATFDLEQTRPFLRSHALDENLVIDFAAIWDSTFRLSYRELRARIKSLTMATVQAVPDAIVIADAAFSPRELASGDRIIFQDDDDWPAPFLFATLAGLAHADGYRWGSLRIGMDFDLTAPGDAILSHRPISSIVYTNNYAVDGGALALAGRSAFFEHGQAATTFAEPGFIVADSDAYLSCAVKHPCSTLAIRWAMAQPAFRADPAGFIAPFIEGLENASPVGSAAWTAEPLEQLKAIMRDL